MRNNATSRIVTKEDTENVLAHINNAVRQVDQQLSGSKLHSLCSIRCVYGSAYICSVGATPFSTLETKQSYAIKPLRFFGDCYHDF
jgi:hypothetical protein